MNNNFGGFGFEGLNTGMSGGDFESPLMKTIVYCIIAVIIIVIIWYLYKWLFVKENYSGLNSLTRQGFGKEHVTYEGENITPPESEVPMPQNEIANVEDTGVIPPIQITNY